MRRIAIIKATDTYHDESYELIAHSITDWTEVTDEEYKALEDNLWRLTETRYCRIIEQLPQKEVFSTVADCFRLIEEYKRREEDRRNKEREDRERRAAEKAEKKRQKELATVEKKQAELERLANELGYGDRLLALKGTARDV